MTHLLNTVLRSRQKRASSSRAAPAAAGRHAVGRPTVPVVNDADREVLQRLTVDELAARRRALVRDYNRELYGAHSDPNRVSAIRAEADAIEQAQRGRRAH